MKTAVLFLAILEVSFAAKFTEDMLWPTDKDCIQELSLDVQTVLDNVDDDYLVTEGNSKINDFTECWIRKINCIDENNEIMFNALKPVYANYSKVIHPKIIEKDQISNDAVEFCKNVEGNGLGDRLVKIGNCIVRQIHKNNK